MQLPKIVLIFLLISFLAGCQVVKPYQRVYLNDSEMQMNNTTAVKMEEKMQDIREGATPPGGAYKTGGCGCN